MPRRSEVLRLESLAHCIHLACLRAIRSDHMDVYRHLQRAHDAVNKAVHEEINLRFEDEEKAVKA